VDEGVDTDSFSSQSPPERGPVAYLSQNGYGHTPGFLTQGFWADPEIVNLCGLGGPGRESPSKMWGAKRPTFWKGFPGRRGPQITKINDVRSAPKPCSKKPDFRITNEPLSFVGRTPTPSWPHHYNTTIIVLGPWTEEHPGKTPSGAVSL
jgi:hypothetical protein